MKNIFASIALGMFLCLSFSPAVFAADPPKDGPLVINTKCSVKKDKTFFGIPVWYKYLNFDAKNNCDIIFATDTNNDGKITKEDKFALSVVWLIALAVFEGLLVVAGWVAFIFVVVGGFKFITAQGEPDKIAKARQTITNALIGAVIAIIGAQIVGFIAGKLI